MKKAIVFGSFVVDLMARAPHLPAPGETVKGSMFAQGPGGKGFNQAVAAKRAGASVLMATKLGKDSLASIAYDKLKSENMSTQCIFETDKASTGTAIIMVDEKTSQNQIVVTSGACDTFDESDIQKIVPHIKECNFLLTQLETNIDAVEHIICEAKKNDVFVILNPAPVQKIDDELYKKIDIITPNEVEASILTGIKINNEADATKAAGVFLEKGVKSVIITLGKKGALVTDGKKYKIIDNYDVDVLDTTGAGDAFNGGLLAALCEGMDIWKASRFANVVSNLAVTHLGTANAMPSRQEIDEFIKKHNI
ncbi:MAG: ribokinase [Ruminococcaceae bacterium]|nr:ribokinase [Oscillospiraceae bacterium]